MEIYLYPICIKYCMSAVENKMNTEMSATIENQIVNAGEKKKKVMKSKTPATKPLLIEPEETENKVSIPVAEPVNNVDETLTMVTAVVSNIVNDAVENAEAQAEYDAMMRQKVELEIKMAMYQEQLKVKKDIKKYRQMIIDDRIAKENIIKEQIEKLREKVFTLENERQAIMELDDNELTSTILGTPELMEVCEIVKEDPIVEAKKSIAKKSAAKKPASPTTQVVVSAKGEIKTKTITKTMKPAERWAVIPNGSLFRAKSKETIRYYKKVTDGVRECDKQGNIKADSPLFAGNQEAANDFRVIAKIDYAISGWEFLQLYNKQTDKAKSLKKWNGEPEYLLW